MNLERALLIAISGLLYHARTQKGLSQEAVATAAGLPLQWYQRTECGDRLPGLPDLLLLLEVLDLSFADVEATLAHPISFYIEKDKA